MRIYWRRLGWVLCVVMVFLAAGTGIACHDDSQVIDQHQQMLDEEGD